MASKTINTQIVLRNDSSTNWAQNNPTLLAGELGIENNTGKFKIGNGTDKWNVLKYGGADEEGLLQIINDNKTKIFSETKTNISQSDSQIISNKVNGEDLSKGDIFIITFNEEKSAYIYNGTDWEAMNGTVDADKVILRDNITMAGDYSQVGNLTKTQSGTATFSTKGKSVAEALQEILSKRLQPSITANPTISITMSQAKSYEVGTSVTPSYTTSFSAGSYTYGPNTGITAQTWTINDTNNISKDTATGTFESLTVGDETNYTLSASATYNAGAIAVDNLGSASNPVVQILAGTANATSKAITGYRSYFYGVLSTSSTEAPLTSSIIRGLKNGGAYSTSKTLTVNGTSSAKRIVVAIPSASLTASRKGLTKVILTSAMNTPVTDSYSHTVRALKVEGANGYTSVDYDVWVYEPASIDAGEVHSITLA